MANNQVHTVLVVDDESEILSAITRDLRKLPVTVITTTSPLHALELVQAKDIDIVVADRNMPEMNGSELLAIIAAKYPEVIRIMLTAEIQLDALLDTVNNGKISSFVHKPWDKHQLINVIQQAIQLSQALIERSLLRYSLAQRDITNQQTFSGIIGQSESMQAVFNHISVVAPSAVSVFIQGPSGTGKELVAEALHKLSPRSSHKMVALNCAAIPSELMESEIFGHVKGAFSGAYEHRQGAASLADGGTLFLDEIGEMDILLQAKLLRFIQTGTFSKVGSSKQEKVNIRLVSATNRDPLAAIREGKLREDLYYRLNVVNLKLPALSTRGDDIILLAQHFLAHFSAIENKKLLGFSELAIKALKQHTWPGNVRELQNSIQGAVLFCQGALITESCLAPLLCRTEPDKITPSAVSETVVDDGIAITDTIESLASTERKHIEHVIRVCGDNVVKASNLLEVSPSTLYRKIQSWGNAEKKQ